MGGNKQAYEAAYRRAVEGKSSRTFSEWLMYPFEDTYTRQSREKGTRDGALARGQAQHATTDPAAPA
jgi:hypothetical protein